MRLVTPVTHRSGGIVDLHRAVVTVRRGRGLTVTRRSRHWPRARVGRPERHSHTGSNQRRTGNEGEISTPGNKGHLMPPLVEKLRPYRTIAGDRVTVTPSLSPSSSAQTPASPEPEPCRVLVTASLAEPAWPGDPGEHRRCPPGLPCLVLPHASAAVTHAGYGTVAACLVHGVSVISPAEPRGRPAAPGPSRLPGWSVKQLLPGAARPRTPPPAGPGRRYRRPGRRLRRADRRHSRPAAGPSCPRGRTRPWQARSPTPARRPCSRRPRPGKPPRRAAGRAVWQRRCRRPSRTRRAPRRRASAQP